MKKFSIMTWCIVGLSWLLTLVLVLIAPRSVAMHFNAAGQVDSTSGRWGLLLEPVLLSLIAGGCSWLAHAQRRRNNLTTLPVILVDEWRYLGLLVVILVVFGWLQLNQVGILN